MKYQICSFYFGTNGNQQLIAKQDHNFPIAFWQVHYKKAEIMLHFSRYQSGTKTERLTGIYRVLFLPSTTVVKVGAFIKL